MNRNTVHDVVHAHHILEANESPCCTRCILCLVDVIQLGEEEANEPGGTYISTNIGYHYSSLSEPFYTVVRVATWFLSSTHVMNRMYPTTTIVPIINVNIGVPYHEFLYGETSPHKKK